MILFPSVPPSQPCQCMPVCHARLQTRLGNQIYRTTTQEREKMSVGWDPCCECVRQCPWLSAAWDRFWVQQCRRTGRYHSNTAQLLKEWTTKCRLGLLVFLVTSCIYVCYQKNWTEFGEVIPFLSRLAYARSCSTRGTSWNIDCKPKAGCFWLGAGEEPVAEAWFAPRTRQVWAETLSKGHDNFTGLPGQQAMQE